eukprot:TRINITY_DN7807_c0_g2_i1.p1 TRINITY_DN7807_c0_g2~~TRINITY_DN7807_c0_g2_i1.p1  ORF type:complete len:436 (-),score=69.90 TRINITY_DN7807_c0_g2_i1:145-1452(-)
MSARYEVIIYTASLSIYANPLIDQLDPCNHTTHRLFREHCTFLSSSYVKDLGRLGRDLKDVIIVDNSPVCYALQPANAVPIATWIDDPADRKLEELVPLLKFLAGVYDVRNYLPRIGLGSDIDYMESYRKFKAEQEVKIEDVVDLSNEAIGKIKSSKILNGGHNKNGKAFAGNSRIFHCRSGSYDLAGRKMEANASDSTPMHYKRIDAGPIKYTPGNTKCEPLNKMVMQPNRIIKTAMIAPSEYSSDKPKQKWLNDEETESCNESTQSKKEDTAKAPRQGIEKPMLINSITSSTKKLNKHSSSIGNYEPLKNKGIPTNKAYHPKERVIRINAKDANLLNTPVQKQAKFPLNQMRIARCLTARMSESREVVKRIPSTNYSPGKLINSQAKSARLQMKYTPISQMLMKINNSALTSILSQSVKKPGVKPIMKANNYV